MKSHKLGLWLFWTFMIGASILFYWDNAVAYLFGYRSERFGQSLFHYQFWFVAHIVGATCSLFLGPVQFWEGIRKKYKRYHRVAGKCYILGSLVAGISSLRLSLINDCQGCRYSLFILSILFLLSTSLAWYAIKQKNTTAHRQFMIRSYTCALAFVFVRLNQLFPLGFLYSAIADQEVKQTVNEWMFSLMPLLFVEIFMIWFPSVRKTIAKHPGTAS